MIIEDQVPELPAIEDVRRAIRQTYRVYLASPMTNPGSKVRKENTRLRAKVKEALAQTQTAIFEIYDPHDHTFVGSRHSPADVFWLDLRQTALSDLLVVIGTPQSHGVGMEALIGSLSHVPRILIWRSGNPISRMLRGVPTSTLAEVEYSKLPDVARQLSAAMPEIEAGVIRVAPHRRRAIRVIKESRLGNFLLKARILKGSTRDDLRNASGVPTELIAAYEDHDECAVLLDVMTLEMLAHALELSFGAASPHSTMRFTESTLDQVEATSLDALVEFARKHRPRDDRRLVSVFRTYLEDYRTAVKAREDMSEPYTVDDWLHAYGVNQLFGEA